MRKHRKEMAMEKWITPKHRSQFWYLALLSFLLWLFLLYLYNSSTMAVSKNENTFYGNYTTSSRVSESDSDSVIVNSEEKDGTLPVSESEETEKDVPTELASQETEKDVLANLASHETDNKEAEEEVKAVNSVVEEVEKEIEMKNNKHVVDRERKSRSEKRISSKPQRKSNKNEKDGTLGVSESEETEKDVPTELASQETEKDVPTNLASQETGNNEPEEEAKAVNSVVEEVEKEIEMKNKHVIDQGVRKSRSEKRISSKPERKSNKNEEVSSDSCSGKYIYVHEIPSLFNEELLKNCLSISQWTDMCELTSNSGLGPQLPDLERVPGWYATNQFTLEVIFHNRMKQYKCLTKDSSLASAIFVPYYPGLDLSRFLWGPYPYLRDAAALDLMYWLRTKPEWKKMSGRDHFMVAGRTTWDFMRTPENESDWGNRLMILPETKNMTMLLIESCPWNYHGFAVPYPTYFHPSNDDQVFQWQTRMRKQRRRWLFSFVGAPRPGLGDNIRNEIMHQCKNARRKCKLLECGAGASKCFKPDEIMKFFESSTFCLQPPGDSYTRRSTFDSILAGCIPVFFHPGSAYVQYIWHLPKDYHRYSVFIPQKEVKQGKTNIERVLSRIPNRRVVQMREEVIRLIPRLIYADPRTKLERTEDAFDVSVQGVLDRVEKIRVKIKEDEELFDFPEEFSWKYNTFGNVENHEWDDYFRH